MKKLLQVALFWALWGIVSVVQTAAQTQPAPVSVVYVTVGTGAQNGNAIDIHAGYSNHQLSWVQLGSTTPTGCSVQVDSSADSVTWTAGGIVAAQNCNTNGVATLVTGVSAYYARIRFTGITAGQVVAAYAAVIGALAHNGGGGGGGTITGATANGGLVATSTTLGLLTTCSANQVLEFIASAWTCATISGTGTVTSFSAGNLSPLFTSSVATPTSTPALTFSLTAAGAGTVFGNNTSASGAPTYNSTPQLGVSGTLGSLTMGNATSGLLTLQPAAGALGTPIVLIPAGNDTLVNLTGTQTLTNKTLTPSEVGLGSVTNDVQTKAAIVPNTAPSAGQILVGNAGGTAYAPVAVSGDSTMTSAGVMTNAKLNGTAFAGVSGHLVSFGAANIPADSGLVAANQVNASSPGAGIAHFAGATQTVTSSLIAIADLSATGTPSATTFLRGDNTWSTPAGAGTVTSVGLQINAGSSSGIFAVSGSPVTTSGNLNYNLTGTSGGVPYFSSASVLSSSAALTQFGVVYGGGAGVAPSVVGPATTPNGVPQSFVSIPSGGVGTAPVLLLPGIAGRNVTVTTTDTIASTDCNPKRIEYLGNAATPITLPTATTLGVANCVFKVVNNLSTVADLTITTTTWTCNGAATCVVHNGQQAYMFVDPNSATNWVADISEQGLTAGSNTTFTRSATGLSIASTGTVTSVAQTVPTGFAIAGSPITTSGTLAITTTGLTTNTVQKAVAGGLGNSTILDNGTTVSTTEPLVSQTFNTCPDSSASGTAQVCNTTPTFTVVAGSCITYTTTTANTGAGLTLNVNSLGAKSVAKWQGSTTLAANDVLANKEVQACYDGTNWELATIGNAPGGSGTVTSVAETVPSGFAIGGTPVTTSGTLAITYSVGSAGQIINSSGANAAGFTATPTLGASGTIGTLAFGNATSGTVTLGTVTGALGAVTASLPANTGTIAELNLAQTWTALQTLTLTNATGLPINGVVSATGAIATIANGNNPLVINCALTSGTTCQTNGETTAATTAGAVELQLTTLTTSTAIGLQITQGANGPANAAAPNIINISAAAAGGLAGASNAGSVGAGYSFPTGNGSAGGATTGNGGAGGTFTSVLGNGGAGGGTTTNNGGNGGGLAVTTGNGGNAAATGTSGNGGAATFTMGIGGTTGTTTGSAGLFSVTGTAPASSATNGQNVGTLFSVLGVIGGATSSTGANTAGTGSSPSITAGAGGAATGAGGNTTVGGIGGAVSLTAGAGGAGSAGNNSGGVGGNINLIPGAGGAKTGTGTAGNSGVVCIGTPCFVVTTPGTGFALLGAGGTEPASIAAGGSGFVMDSTSNCPIQWNNAANVGCSAALAAIQTWSAAQTFGTGDILLPAAVGTSAANGPLTIQAGIDATTTGASAIFIGRGEDVTGGATASIAGGAATLRGGNNASTGNSAAGGAVNVLGGDATGGTGTTDTGGNAVSRGGNCTSTTGSCTPGTISSTSGGFTAAFTNGAASDNIIAGGLGTGNAAVSHVKIQSPALSQTSGTTAQTQVTRFTTHVKAGSTTSATATNMFNVALANNQTAGVTVLVHVETTQATPHNCSTANQYIFVAQDTAGTITSNVVTIAATAATICDTGTLTLTVAASAAAPTVFSVTPSWTTIVPTAVTITVEILNGSQQDITLL